MLTVSEDDDDLFESIKAGANGYLLKNVRPEQLFEDLRGVMRGEAPIAPAVATKLLEALRTGGIPARGQPAAAPEDSVLTRRESEILQLVAAGMSNKEIANELTITEGTVKNHVHNALEKLHLTNRVQAAAYAVRQGYANQDGTGTDRCGRRARGRGGARPDRGGHARCARIGSHESPSRRGTPNRGWTFTPSETCRAPSDVPPGGEILRACASRLRSAAISPCRSAHASPGRPRPSPVGYSPTRASVPGDGLDCTSLP